MHIQWAAVNMVKGVAMWLKMLQCGLQKGVCIGLQCGLWNIISIYKVLEVSAVLYT